MITPIRTMTIDQICERKDDLLIGSDDIKKIAKSGRNKAIDEFVEKLCERGCELAYTTTVEGIPADILTLDTFTDTVLEIAEQMKGEWGMTKGEYCKSKGLHIPFPNFNPNDELTEDFKNTVDTLVDNFDDIYNENEDSEV